MKEIWKDIIGYKGLYQVSNNGNVKSLGNGNSNNSKEKILKQAKVRGYYQVTLCKEGKQKHYFVHRLVATAFIANPDNLPEVNHKNEIKTDNCVENLEWVTHKENSNYGTRNERIGKVHSIIKIGNQYANKPILQFNREGTKILGKYNSAIQASEILGIDNSNINKCCRGEYNFCGGFRWMYLQDYIDRMEKLYQLTIKKVS